MCVNDYFRAIAQHHLVYYRTFTVDFYASAIGRYRRRHCFRAIRYECMHMCARASRCAFCNHDILQTNGRNFFWLMM